MASELSSLIDKQMRSYDDVEKGNFKGKVRACLSTTTTSAHAPRDVTPSKRKRCTCITHIDPMHLPHDW